MQLNLFFCFTLSKIFSLVLKLLLVVTILCFSKKLFFFYERFGLQSVEFLLFPRLVDSFWETRGSLLKMLVTKQLRCVLLMKLHLCSKFVSFQRPASTRSTAKKKRQQYSERSASSTCPTWKSLISIWSRIFRTLTWAWAVHAWRVCYFFFNAGNT